MRDKVHRLVVPSLQEAELDAWLLVERGFQHDPMLKSIGITEPGDKAVLFVDGDRGQLRAFAFATSPAVIAQIKAARLFEQVQPLTPEAVIAALDRFHPQAIGIDYSARLPLADGIATGSRQFAAWLVGRGYAGKFRPAEVPVVRFRSTRTSDQVEFARQAARCAAEIAGRALSERTIVPGRTTVGELIFQLSGGVRSAGLESRSAPQVRVMAQHERGRPVDSTGLADPEHVIREGDLVRVVLSVRYAGVAANASKTVYVRSRSESEVPADVRRALDAAQQVRGGIAPLFRVGRTGSQIAADAAAWARQHRITVELEVHPVGDEAIDVGTMLSPSDTSSFYRAGPMLTERPLQAGDIQSLGFSVTVVAGDGRRLVLSTADDGVVGFGGLDFLTDPDELLVVPRL